MKSMKAKVSFLTGLFIFMALIVCTPAAALPTAYIDFNMDGSHPFGASISFAGGATPLVGVNISVDNVAGFDANGVTTPVLPITNGILTFTTGNLTSYNSGFWTFGSGGSITITGTTTPTGPVTLLSGSFSSATVQQLGSGNFKFSVLGGSIIDTKDPALSTHFFGYAAPSFLGGVNLSFKPVTTAGNSFYSSSVLSGDVYNTPVPLPGAVWLLGAGLVGLVVVRRKFKS